MDATISKTVENFRSWFSENGGFFHPDAQFQPDASGYKIIAGKEIPADTTVATCPFSSTITKELATRAILPILKIEEMPSEWTERQLICTYICLHWVFEASPKFPETLVHLPYLTILPKPEQLLTPLHFSEKELELFRGSHVYAATGDRRGVLQNEWQICFDYLITNSDGEVYRQGYTWERYLTAATYLSSRAFPSTLMSEKPSVVASKDSYPVLFPGVDSLNHARGRPISWVVAPLSPIDPDGESRRNLGLSLHVHVPSQPGDELLNNYGRKPNSELILGYGFSLEGNPDDTLVLSVGGGPTTPASSSGEKQTWEVGREARRAEGVWDHVQGIISSGSEPEGEDSEATRLDNQLYAANTLSEMCQEYLARLPQIPAGTDLSYSELRPEVLTMLTHYIEGQRDILESMIRFAEGKEGEALEEAQKLGIELESE